MAIVARGLWMQWTEWTHNKFEVRPAIIVEIQGRDLGQGATIWISIVIFFAVFLQQQISPRDLIR